MCLSFPLKLYLLNTDASAQVNQMFTPKTSSPSKPCMNFQNKINYRAFFNKFGYFFLQRIYGLSKKLYEPDNYCNQVFRLHLVK